MNRSTIAFIALLVFLTGLLGYNYVKKPFGTIAVPESTARPSTSPVAGNAFDQLTSAQKVALILAAPITITKSGEMESDQLAWIKTHQPGTVTLFGDAISTVSALQATTEVSATYRPLWAVDHEGGSVQRLKGTGFTVLPSWQHVCLQPVAKRTQLLANSAQELQTVGIDIVFGPVVDLSASGSAMGSRTCGSSAELVAQRSQEYIEAFMAKDIVPVIKHFPGIGSIKQDLHYQAVATETNEAELAVYEYILQNHPDLGVMVAHVSLSELGGEVCSLSQQCVGGLKNLFENILVFTDALDMTSAAGVASESATPNTLADRAVAAIKAGNDVLVFGRDTSSEDLDQVLTSLVALYESDSEIKKSIDESAQKIVTLTQKKHSP